MTTYLREMVEAECAAWGHLGIWDKRYIHKDAIQNVVNVSATIGLHYGANPTRVISEAITQVQTLLLPENQEIEGTLDFGDLHAAIMGITGVSWVEFDTPSEDVYAGIGGINVFGTATFTIGT